MLRRCPNLTAVGIDPLPGIRRAAWRALRPGGWLMFAVLAPAPDQIAGTAFRAAVWGGDVLGGGVALTRATGFSRVEGTPPTGWHYQICAGTGVIRQGPGGVAGAVRDQADEARYDGRVLGVRILQRAEDVEVPE